VTELNRTYSAPDLTYHGTVSELTRSQTLVVAGQAVRFAGAFANSLGGGPIITPGPGEVINPHSGGVITEIASGGATGGGPSGATGGGPSGAIGGGGTGGGGKLPFTGLAVMGVAAVGAALAAGGVALKRIIRKPPSS
jgi:hypothetical protein